MNKLIKYDLVINQERRRVLQKNKVYRTQHSIDCSHIDNVLYICRNILKLDKYAEEYAYIIALGMDMIPIGCFEIAHGDETSVNMGVREIFIRLLMIGASKFILVHNHPTFLIDASQDDLNVTERIRKMGINLDIPLVDHIIFTPEDYYSFEELNII